MKRVGTQQVRDSPALRISFSLPLSLPPFPCHLLIISSLSPFLLYPSPFSLDVAMYNLKESNALVEEWMLLANITGTLYLSDSDISLLPFTLSFCLSSLLLPLTFSLSLPLFPAPSFHPLPSQCPRKCFGTTPPCPYLGGISRHPGTSVCCVCVVYLAIGEKWRELMRKKERYRKEEKERKI
jgi:hypothetical protein